ncbi:MAG: helix-hairpin-helix domain-containing protein, partial [Eubacterium sp.]|nr:helix-hairpin-helix domain-containing protein [Eubacterium sp.]
LNTCTAAELMTIDMIGQTRANAIIAYRDYLGGYTSVEQLRNISGIGDSVYAAIEPYVTV